MSKCDTCGKKQYGYLCDGCVHDPNATDKYEPMTNADRIRAMSDEELAVYICGIFDEYDDDIGGKFINGCYIPCYDEYSIKEWLQQPAEVTDNG